MSKNNSVLFNKKDKYCIRKISDYLAESLKEAKYKRIKILNIGTDECIGDSLAPLVGTMLKEMNPTGVDIIGDLSRPVDAERINKVVQKHITENDFVIAVDSAISINEEHVGCITIRNGSITPGTCMGHSLPSIGNVSILGFVNTACNNEDLNFRAIMYFTPLERVYSTAKIIAMSINNAVNKCLNGE